MKHFFQKYIFFCAFCLLPGVLCAQAVVSGRIVHQDGGAPIAGAHVFFPGIGGGTFSDEGGFFHIAVRGPRLQVSAVGFSGLTYLLQPKENFILLQMVPEGVDLEGVVIEAPALRFPLHTPASVQMIGQRELLSDSEVSPAPALNRVPGVYMQSGTLSTNRITIRGIGNRSLFGTSKIRAFLGDIPLTNGVGETALEDFDLSMLESVEVWKGPSASHLGAGLGGVIVLQPFATGPVRDEARADVQSQWGAFGLRRQVFRTFITENEGRTRLQLNYNRLNADGYRENNVSRRGSFNALGMVSGGRHEFTLLAGYTDARAEIPSSINQKDFEENPRRAAPSWAAVKGFEDYDRLHTAISHRMALWKNAAGKSLHSKITGFAAIRNNYESRPFNILRENSQSMGVRTTLELRADTWTPDPSLLLGGEFFQERYAWVTNATRQGTLDTLLSDQEEVRRYGNLFAEYRARFGARWNFTAGLNLNLTEYRLSDFYLRDGRDKGGIRYFPAIFSPRLALSYRLPPQSALYITLGHGFAAPTLEETLAPAGDINPEIVPEKGWNLEIGARGNYLRGRLSYEIAVYALWVDDLLVSRRTDLDAYIGVNAGKTLHLGVEPSFRYQFLSQNWQGTLGLGYAFSRHRFLDFTDNGRDFSGNALTGSPPHLFTTLLDLRAPGGIFGILSTEFVDAFPMRDDNSAYSRAYFLANIKLGYQCGRKNPGIELSTGIQNLTNARYAGMIQINAAAFGNQLPRYYYPGLPRHLFISLRVQVNKPEVPAKSN
jgi:iron complex outermembrane receptor protein